MIKSIFGLLFLLGVWVPVLSAQQFFQWKDQKGRWNFSDSRPADVTAENVNVIFYPPATLGTQDPYSDGYREGFNSGYEQGYRDYYKRQFEQGRQEGYKEGYGAWKSEKAPGAVPPP